MRYIGVHWNKDLGEMEQVQDIKVVEEVRGRLTIIPILDH